MKIMGQVTNGKTSWKSKKPRRAKEKEKTNGISTLMTMQKITIWNHLVNMLSMLKIISLNSQICQSKSSFKFLIQDHTLAKINTTWPFSTLFYWWFSSVWPFWTTASTSRIGTDLRKKTPHCTSRLGRWTWLHLIVLWSVFITSTTARMASAAWFAKCSLTSCWSFQESLWLLFWLLLLLGGKSSTKTRFMWNKRFSIFTSSPSSWRHTTTTPSAHGSKPIPVIFSIYSTAAFNGPSTPPS